MPMSVRPGLNPLRQAQYSEELPRPAAPTPQQALRANGWDARDRARIPTTYTTKPPTLGTHPILHGWFVHTDPNDPYRSIGWGEPLVDASRTPLVCGGVHRRHISK